jgi:hypothetical protein
MKKIIFLSILLIITGFQLYSQRTRDVLYLKNGSIINSTLMEITDNQYKIRTADGSIFVFPAAEVDKYVKGIAGFAGRKKEGMGFALEAGFLAGAQHSEYVLPFSFNFLANFTADTKNIFAIGTGVEFIGQTFSPVFFEYKYLLYERKTTPFIFLRGGGLLHSGKNDDQSGSYNPYYTTHDYKGGLSFAIGTGISWSKEDIETYLSFAYRYAMTSSTEKNYNSLPVTYKNYYNRLEIKFGFKF